MNTSAIERAAASSASRPNATIPPNALTVSDANAAAYATADETPTAAPHGLLCFTMTADGPSGSRSAASVSAASTSSQLLNDMSLPSRRTSAPPRIPEPATSENNAPRWCGFSPYRRSVVFSSARPRNGGNPSPPDANQPATAASYAAVCANASAARRRRRSSVVPPSAISARIAPYAAGSTTTVTDGKFFAAARTIAGPPMSICSTTSSGPAPLATVSRNG